jgi:hypothetical protein
MAHTELGFQVVQQFLADLAAYGHPDFEPKLIGRGLNVMISPLPRNKRARAPQPGEGGELPARPRPRIENNHQGLPVPGATVPSREPELPKPGGFTNNPFAELELKR